MKRKFLEDLGLETDAIEKIMAEAGKDVTSLKARVLGHTGNYLLTTIDAKHNNYYVGVYDKEYNTIEEKFTSFKEVEELKEKYSPVVIDQTTPYQVEQIVSYTKKLKSENPHGVNPIYLKLPEAMEKKC